MTSALDRPLMTRLMPLLPLLLGAVAATGFAPLDLWPLTILAFAVLLRLVHDARSLRGALTTGWLFGVGHFTINNNWIQHAFDFQDKMPPVLGYGAVVALALYLAVYPMIAAGVAWRLASPRAVSDPSSRVGAPFVLVFAAAWIVAEWLRATMFTGYAWSPLGTAWLPVIGIARTAAWVGTYALSGVMIVAAGALLLAIRGRWRFAAPVAALLAVVALTGMDGSITPPATDASAPVIRVVQPNVGNEDRKNPDHDAMLFNRMLELSGRPGPAPRLVLWPEGAVNYYLEDGYPDDWYFKGDPQTARARIAAVLGPRDRALVGGTALMFDSRREISGAGNSIFVIQPDAKLGGRYDKAHLVPYGEYLPMRGLLEPLGLSRLVAGEIDFVESPGPATIPVPGFGKIGMQICYEIIFPGQVVNRADRPTLLFNPSNDAWFGAWGPPQHLAQARMRAIEEGIAVARSTPNGISAVISPTGRLLATIPRHVAGAVEVPLPAPLPPTLFARLGNGMTVFAVIALLALAVAIRRR